MTTEPATDRRIRIVTLTLVAILCLLAIANVYHGRVWLAPPDLYRKDQNKTMAYTVDIVLNGRFSLPRDVIYQPATKPPLYNWLAAAVVGPTGIYDEWAQKWPSMAGAIVIAAALLIWCRRSFADRFEGWQAWMIGLLAAAIWIATKFTVSLLYIARPDMVQATCLILAWMAGVAALRHRCKRDARGAAIGFWIAVTAAALAKGPAAVYPILFVLIAAKLVVGRWGRLRNLYWIPGLLVLFGSIGLWLACAYRQDPQHVKGVLIGTEVVKRIAASNPEGFVKPVYYSAMWFVAQNPYWSAAAIFVVLAMLVLSIRSALEPTYDAIPEPMPRGGLHAERTFVDYASASVRVDTSRPLVWQALRIGIARFFAGPIGAPTLWILVVLACLSIPKDKRMDFLLPTYPAVAIVCAYGLVAVLAKTAWGRYALPFAAVAFVIWQGRPMSVETIGDAIDRWMRPGLMIPAAYTLKILAGLLLAAALAAVVWLTRRFIRLEFVLVAVGVLYWSGTMVQSVYKQTRAPRSVTVSSSAADFATASRTIVGDDKVVCLIRSKHPLLTLMGRHQGSYLTRADIEQAEWVIAEVSKFPHLKPRVKTRKAILVDYGDIIDTERPIAEDHVGLFKIDRSAGVPSVDELVAIQKWVANWTNRDANPYRSPNTVWIDSPSDPPMWTPPPGDPWIERNRKAASRPVVRRRDEGERAE